VIVNLLKIHLYAGKLIKGAKWEWMFGFILLLLSVVDYHRAIGRSNCFHEKGQDAPFHICNNLYTSIFGLIQIIFSQIPDTHKMWWLSIVATVMSFSYSLIGLGLGIGTIVAG